MWEENDRWSRSGRIDVQPSIAPPVYSEPPNQNAPQVGHVQSAVLVPFLQALITGFLCGLAVLVIAGWFPGWPYWRIGGTAIVVFAAGSWLSYRNRWQWILERILWVDLNHDGIYGQPVQQVPVQPDVVRVVVEQDNGRSLDIIDLPYPEEIKKLAPGFVNGSRLFAQDSCADVLPRPKFNLLRDQMISRGLARWKVSGSPKQGSELTPAGRALMRRYAEPHSPALTSGRDEND